MGGFNFPNIIWDSGPPHLSPPSVQAQEFLDMCSLFSLTQLITDASRVSLNGANTLDLLFTTNPEFVSDTVHLPGISGHVLINFHLKIPHPKTEKVSKIILDYNRANFQAIIVI